MLKLGRKTLKLICTYTPLKPLFCFIFGLTYKVFNYMFLWNFIEKIYAMTLWLNKRPNNSFYMNRAFGLWLFLNSLSTLLLIGFLIYKINKQLCPIFEYGLLIAGFISISATIIFHRRKISIGEKYINYNFRKEATFFVSYLIGTPIYFAFVIILIINNT